MIRPNWQTITKPRIEPYEFGLLPYYSFDVNPLARAARGGPCPSCGDYVRPQETIVYVEEWVCDVCAS